MTLASPCTMAYFAALSDPGQLRPHNEDSLLCLPQQQLWAIADGMGGHQRGEVASALALQVLAERVQAGDELLQATAAAHQAICQAAEDDPASQGMGTTLVAVRLQAQRFQLVWVGDSRAYRVGPQHIEQLSHDHSWVQSMLDIGQLDAEQARQHPQRNLILQCLGQAGAELQPGWLEGQLADNEILLLCSDGLSSELEDAEILACCNTAATLEELVSQLVGAANAAGGRDNISCLVLAPALAARPLPADKPGLLGQWLAAWRNL